MICRIGLYTFTSHKITGLSEELSINYAKIDRVGNNPYRQDVGGYDETITVTGELIKDKVDVLEYFKLQAKAKIPVRFTTINGSFLVLITGVREGKDIFVKGVHLKNAFEISLVRYWGSGTTALLNEVIGLLT